MNKKTNGVISIDEFKKKIKDRSFVKDVVRAKDAWVSFDDMITMIGNTAGDPQDAKRVNNVASGNREFALKLFETPVDFILIELVKKDYRFNTTINTIRITYFNDIIDNMVEDSMVSETLTISDIGLYTKRFENWVASTATRISAALIGNWKFMENHPDDTLKAFDKMQEIRKEAGIDYDGSSIEDESDCGECDGCEYSERCADSTADPKTNEEMDDQDITITCKTKEEADKIISKIKSFVSKHEDDSNLWDKLSSMLNNFVEEDIDKKTDDEIDDSEDNEIDDTEKDDLIDDESADQDYKYCPEEDEDDEANPWDNVMGPVGYDTVAEAILCDNLTASKLILLHHTKSKTMPIGEYYLNSIDCPMMIRIREVSGITPINTLKKNPNTGIGAKYEIDVYNGESGEVHTTEFDYSKKTISDIITTHMHTGEAISLSQIVKSDKMSNAEIIDTIYDTICDQIIQDFDYDVVEQMLSDMDINPKEAFYTFWDIDLAPEFKEE